MLGKGRISVCSRRKRRRKSDFFSVFPCNLSENPYLFACLSLCAIVLFLFMRGRVFLVVAPRVFYLGGLFRFGGRDQIFLFFSCKSGEDQYSRDTSIMSI